MPKYCFNYDSGEYEWIEEDGYSIDQGEYVYNWDDSEYRSEQEEEDQDDWSSNWSSYNSSDDEDSW